MLRKVLRIMLDEMNAYGLMQTRARRMVFALLAAVLSVLLVPIAALGEPGTGTACAGPDVIAGAYGQGDEYALVIPEEECIIQDPVDPAMPRYGSSFVFFAACAGTLGLADETEAAVRAIVSSGNADASSLMALAEVFPLTCRDSSGRLVGPDDFVAGYSQLFVYETELQFTNTNPVIDGFVFHGHEGCNDVDPYSLAYVWEGESPRQLEDICGSNIVYVRACEDDGDLGCAEYPLKPLLRPEIVEPDSVYEHAYGTPLAEQMWINYYVDRGGLTRGVKLLNDAQTGWNSDYGTEFLAPKEPGPVQIWAVVHDNRGGVGWVRRTVIVE